MAIDAHDQLADRRTSVRRALDARVELTGGGVSIEGRAVDVSTSGIAVRVHDRTLHELHGAPDAVTAFRAFERHFTGGLVVRFLAHGDVCVPARIVRVIVPPTLGGEFALGLRFARALAPDEWASVTGARRPTPMPALAPVRLGPPVQVLVTDPAAGPVCLLRALRWASSFVEGSVEGPRARTVDEVRASLGGEARPTRITVGADILWAGDARMRTVYATSTGGLCVTLEMASPLSDALLLRRGRTR